MSANQLSALRKGVEAKLQLACLDGLVKQPQMLSQES